MRKILILVAMGLFIACSSTRVTSNLSNNRKLDTLYKIMSIKNEKSFYLIYAVRNDSTFKIVVSIR